MKKLIAGSIYLTVIRAAGILLQAITMIILARKLPIEDVGYFASLYAFLGTLRFLGPLGTDQIILRQIAGRHRCQVSYNAHVLMDTAVTLSLYVGILTSLALFIFLIASRYNTSITNLQIISIALSAPSFSMMGVFIAQIRGLGYIIAAQFPESFLFHFIFLFLVITSSIIFEINNNLIYLYMCISSWTIIIIYILIRKKIGLSNFLYIPIKQIIKLGTSGLSILISLVFTVLSAKLPIFLALNFFGPSSAAILDIALRFGNLAMLTTSSIGASFSPQFAQLFNLNNFKELKKTLLYACAISIVPATIWLFIVFFGAEFTIELIFPVKYKEAILLTILVAFASSINAGFGLATTLLIMSNKENIVSLLSFLQLAAIIFLPLFFSSHIGLLSVIIGMIIGSFIRDAVSFIYTLNKFN